MRWHTAFTDSLGGGEAEQRLITSSELWNTLRNVRSLRFEAISRSKTGWTGKGTGQVTVSDPTVGTLLFQESGSWLPPQGSELRFVNTFKWSKLGETLRLEHLRFGADNPVFLFELASVSAAEWRDVSPHHCVDDCYSASVKLCENEVHVAWSIRGPQKDESISYVYW